MGCFLIRKEIIQRKEIIHKIAKKMCMILENTSKIRQLIQQINNQIKYKILNKVNNWTWLIFSTLINTTYKIKYKINPLSDLLISTYLNYHIHLPNNNLRIDSIIRESL